MNLENEGCRACGAPENWKKLLEEAHDKMDDLNAAHQEMRLFAWCNFCHESGYDANGLIHDEDCILVKIRKILG